MDPIWLKRYPPGVPATIDTSGMPTLVALMADAFSRHARKTAYKFMGCRYSFERIDAQAQALAGYLQSLGLAKGDRVAVMMPNVPQYPVAVAAILRAGFVAVNVNPLYTARELTHQLADSGASAIVILENFAHVLQASLPSLPQLSGEAARGRLIVTAFADELPRPRRWLVNAVVRHVKKLVPAWTLPGSVSWGRALAVGARSRFTAPAIGSDDLALLQYTGGTTGTARGAMLLHRNLVANVLQSQAWNEPAFAGQEAPLEEDNNVICALPLYHIFAFTVNMMLSMHRGSCSVLIPNARDIAAMLGELRRHRFHTLLGVNTLFNALVHHPDFGAVDWRHLRLSVGGGAPVTRATAQAWLAATGCAICEGYGLTETSPSVACNPTNSQEYTGTIGMPLPSTDIKLVDDAGREVPAGEFGEIAVKGPQLMAGYWRQPEETARALTSDGYFRTGDIGAVDERGYFRVVDRKKDMVLVSGFNVYPNEIEDIVSQMPGVLECAAVGVPDEHSGEAVRLVIVKTDNGPSEDEVRAWCAERLTGYKRPKFVEFRRELPKTPIGKVLRRQLREPA